MKSNLIFSAPCLNCALIIPLYNKQGQIQRTLDSVLRQRIPFRQVIIVNDCSTDGSAAIVKRFIDEHPNIAIQFIQHLHNCGPGGARNTGLAASECDYACFLDADDYLSPTASEDLNRVLRDCKTSPGLIIYRVQEKGNGAVRPDFQRLRRLALSQTLGTTLLKLNDWASAMTAEPLFCSGGNVLISRHLSVCRFDPSLRNFEDWDFYFRACQTASKSGLDILVSDHIGLTYTEDDDSGLSRAAAVSASLRNPPSFVRDTSLPLAVRRYTSGIWLCHVTQRSKWGDGLRFIVKALRETGDARPFTTHLLAAGIGLLLGRKGWNLISLWRKRWRYG